MNFQQPNEENDAKNPQKQIQGSSSTLKSLQKSRRRRKNKSNIKKNKQNNKEFLKKKSKFAHTMSSWAESFTVAATWQLKHQLAYWKARAKAMEYENKVLHDVIRKNCISVSQTDLVPPQPVVPSESEEEQTEEEIDENNDEEGFEVSEEFIEFVRANAKYKEEARLERERLKAKNLAEEKSMKEQLESAPVIEDNTANLKELYGDHWQKIGALEMALQSRFIEETDRENTSYWPVIPFNFNFS